MTKMGSSLLVACCIVAVCCTDSYRPVRAGEAQDLKPKLLGAWGLVGPPTAEGEPRKGRLKF